MTKFSVLVSVVVAVIATNAKAMSCDVHYENLPTKIQELEAERDTLRAEAMGEGLVGGVTGGGGLATAAMMTGSVLARAVTGIVGVGATALLWIDAGVKKAHYQELESEIAATQAKYKVYLTYRDAKETLLKREHANGQQKEEKEKYSERLDIIASKVSTSLKEWYFVPNQVVGLMESGQLCEETSAVDWSVHNFKQLTQAVKEQIKFEATSDKESDQLVDKTQMSMR